MGEDGSSALKTGGLVPFDVATTSDLCGLRLAIPSPIDLEHMPTHASHDRERVRLPTLVWPCRYR
jgi:hypothetical protein